MNHIKYFYFLLLIVGLNLPIFAANAQSPAAPQPLYSNQIEQKAGQEFMHDVEMNLALVTDPLITEFINKLGQRLTAVMPSKKHFYFFVVNDPSINAFAGPYGYIGINSGTILAAQNPEQVASVLAHEMAHVLQNHLLRSSELGRAELLPMLGAIAAGIAVGGEVGTGVATASIASAMQANISFTKQNEQEADREGMKLLAAAGFDPEAMPNFFKILSTDDRFYQTPPPFLQTHPSPESRIADSLNRAKLLTVTPREPIADELNFKLLQTRLAVETSDDVANLLANYRLSSSKQSSALINQFRLALIYSRMVRFPAALKTLSELVKQNPDRIILRLSLADVALQAHQAKFALTILTAKPSPDYSYQLLYAKTLAANDAFDKAEKIYQQLINNDPTQMLVYFQLAELKAKQQQLAAAYLNEARGLILLGEPERAKALLATGLKQTPLPASVRSAIYLLQRQLPQ